MNDKMKLLLNTCQQLVAENNKDFSGFENLTGLSGYEPTVSVSTESVFPPPGGLRGALFP